MTRFYLSPVKNKETSRFQIGLKKNGYHPNVIYLSEKPSQEVIAKSVRNDDILEIAAEGCPWVIGSVNSDEFYYTPFRLAQLLASIITDLSITLTIDLRTCNSATIAKGKHGEICFARDLSEALDALGYSNIQVRGYTGYIQYRGFKQSVVGAINHGTKEAHCKLEDAMVIYQNGKIHTPSKRTIVSTMKYSSKEIEDYLSERSCHFEPVESLTYAFNALKISSVSTSVSDNTVIVESMRVNRLSGN